MKVQFNFIHLDVSEALQEYTELHLNEIGKFLLKDGQCHCFVSKTRGAFAVEITVQSSKQKYFKATASKHDIYEAVDAVIDKLERQFLKTKSLVKNHKKFEISREGRLRDLNGKLEPRTPLKKVA